MIDWFQKICTIFLFQAAFAAHGKSIGSGEAQVEIFHTHMAVNDKNDQCKDDQLKKTSAADQTALHLYSTVYKLHHGLFKYISKLIDLMYKNIDRMHIDRI
jgi:hypothetical protein